MVNIIPIIKLCGITKTVQPELFIKGLYCFQIPSIGDLIYSFKWIIKSSNLLCRDIYNYLSECEMVVIIGGLPFMRYSVINSTIFSHIMGKKHKMLAGEYVIPFECGMTADRCIPIGALFYHKVEFLLITKKLPFDIKLQFKYTDDPNIHNRIKLTEYPVLIPYNITDDYFNPLFFVIYYKNHDRDIELLRFEYEYALYI